MRIVVAVLLCSIAYTDAQATRSSHPRHGATVLKVVASTGTGERAFGSAVVIGPERVATNCHVLRHARRFEVEHEGKRSEALLHAADPNKDLCLLTVRGLSLPPAPIRRSTTVQVGEPVSAAGYADGAALVVQAGRVEALHAFDDARVIQTSAPFDHGASGGALFNAAGELVGILTFKVPSGGPFHFAIPADWIDEVAARGLTSELSVDDCAFWEQSPTDRVHFLSAVWHEANRNWAELYAHCLHWLSAEPENQSARRSMLRAIEQMMDRATR